MSEKDVSYQKDLIQAVINNDVMVDKLIIKDVQVGSVITNFPIFDHNLVLSTLVFQMNV